jgi:hypothetical protein
VRATGRIRTPVDKVPNPRMNWKYCVTRKMKPNKAKKATVTEALAAEKAGVRNSVTSIIGRARRLSTATKPVTSAAAMANPARLAALLQPRPGASMIV